MGDFVPLQSVFKARGRRWTPTNCKRMMRTAKVPGRAEERLAAGSD